MKYYYYENSNKSGIYKITNIKNNRFYIGSAKLFKERARSHLNNLKNNKHKNQFFQNDFNKCGEDAFIFEVIEVIFGPKEERIKKEQEYLNIFHDNQNSCYNICKKADMPNSSKGYRHSQQIKDYISYYSKLKWREPQYRNNLISKLKGKKKPPFTIEHRKNIGNAARGRKLSEETKNKLRKNMKGNKLGIGRIPWNKGIPCQESVKLLISIKNKGRKISTETKNKISTNNKQKRKIIATNIQTKKVIEFESIILASKTLQISLRVIFRVLKNEKKQVKKWTFKYL